MYRKYLPLIISMVVLSILVVGAVFAWRYFSSRINLTVNYSDASDVVVLEENTRKQIGEINASGDSIRLKKDTEYRIEYSGNDGFADGFVKTDGKEDEVTIKPYYSRERLDSMLNNSLIIVLRDTIKKKYPSVEQDYSVQKGKLYHFGDWYSTELKYKKGYNLHSDNLRIVLKKDSNNAWSVATEPNITLDKFTYSSVPEDILRDVNEFDLTPSLKLRE